MLLLVVLLLLLLLLGLFCTRFGSQILLIIRFRYAQLSQLGAIINFQCPPSCLLYDAIVTFRCCAALRVFCVENVNKIDCARRFDCISALVWPYVCVCTCECVFRFSDFPFTRRFFARWHPLLLLTLCGIHRRLFLKYE